MTRAIRSWTTCKTTRTFGFGSGRGEKEHGNARDPERKGDQRKYVKPSQPPCINFFGAEDPLLADARRFQEVYKKAGNRFELFTYEGETHSFFNKGANHTICACLSKPPQSEKP